MEKLEQYRDVLFNLAKTYYFSETMYKTGVIIAKEIAKIEGQEVEDIILEMEKEAFKGGDK